MPEHDGSRGVEEQAYLDAEALLDDEAMRARRRAGVLAAITDAPSVAAQTEREPRPGHPFLRRGGWLAAAGVAGLSALIAIDYYSPATHREPPEKSMSAPPAPGDPSSSVARAPAQPPPALQPTPRAQPAAPLRGEDPASQDAASAETAPLPQARREPSPPPPPSPTAPVVAERFTDLADVHARSAPAPAAARGSAAGMKAAEASATTEARSSQAGRLRMAASRGQVSELTTLLAQGVSVDARGARGETALMSAVRERQVAAAELLVRNGANPDLEDEAGISARDIAMTIDDPELIGALKPSR